MELEDLMAKLDRMEDKLASMEAEVLEKKWVIKIELSDGQWANLKAGGKIVECTDSTIVTVKYRKRG